MTRMPAIRNCSFGDARRPLELGSSVPGARNCSQSKKGIALRNSAFVGITHHLGWLSMRMLESLGVMVGSGDGSKFWRQLPIFAIRALWAVGARACVGN